MLKTFTDQHLIKIITEAELAIETILNCNLVHCYGIITPDLARHFVRHIEKLSSHAEKKDTLAICLTTPGGSVEPLEVIVTTIRKYYQNVFFLVPEQAMSAGTIFVMSGDKIFMHAAASLGPIDPQVPRQGNFVPALGYLDKVKELIDASATRQLNTAEAGLLLAQDLGFLRLCEQARDLSVNLLKEWLIQYKFKTWDTHRRTIPGSTVTPAQKAARAEDIAKKLADNKIWHTHGRNICMGKVRSELLLEIEDMAGNHELLENVRLYNDLLSEYYAGRGIQFALFSRLMYN